MRGNTRRYVFTKKMRDLSFLNANLVGSNISLNCDVTSDKSMDEVFSKLKNEWGNLDFFVHAIAYSDKEELTGLYLDTSRENFNRTMDISVYSFTTLANSLTIFFPLFRSPQ